jgi:hypothetical protein
LNYWIVNCGYRESIGEPDAETMGSTPLLTKIDWHLELSFIRVPSPKFFFSHMLHMFIVKLFIGILGESFEIQVFGYVLYRF